MDNFNLIYIIALVIYFIYSALKKGKRGAEDANDIPSGPSQPRRPASFEDLLREIRESQQEKSRDLEASGQGDLEEEDNYRKDPEPVIQSYESDRGTLHKEKPRKSRYEAFEGEISQEGKTYKKLDDQVSIYAPIEGIKSELKKERLNTDKAPNRYLTMLKNPQTIKDAVVLSEILNRKY
jgi:hypothetical protein